jgi:hypothetical protein
MDTTCTTILSATKDEALEEFHDWVHERPVVLFVIFGEGPAVETLVIRADRTAAQLSRKFAGLPHVIWARHPEDLTDELAQLTLAPEFNPRDLLTPQAIALNLTDEVVDVIPKGEDVDLTRIFQAFNAALRRAGT